MAYGDDVVLYIDPENLTLVRLAEKGFTDNQHGKFKHEFFVGKQFGTKVMSHNGKGYVYALKLSPEFFTKTLLHRTQILYSADIALVLMKLRIERGSVVVESGTGSCSMTYSLAEAVGSSGLVASFEFNKERHESAKSVFGKLGIANTVFYHRNVLDDGFSCGELAARKATAVFLDLPRPQDAIDHALKVLQVEGRLCSFSPCIEQIVATAQMMSKRGFLDIQVVECVERRFQRKRLREGGAGGEGEGPRVSFLGGQKEDRTHTGYLLFGTLYELS